MHETIAVLKALLPFNLENLEDMDTVHSGQFDNLKYYNDKVKVWLSRMTVEDGAKFNNMVTIEVLENGNWKEAVSFPLALIAQNIPLVPTKQSVEMTEERFWKIVEECGWGTKTIDDKAIKKILLKELSKEEAKEFTDIKRKFMAQLDKKLAKVISNLGDDSYGDLLSHIIGLGKAEFEAVLNDPQLAKIRAEKYQFVESFSYVFPYDKDYDKLGNKAPFVEWANRCMKAYADATIDHDCLPIDGYIQTVILALGEMVAGNVNEFLSSREEVLKALNSIEKHYEKNRHCNCDMDGIGNKHSVINLYSDVQFYLKD
ncbi:MAG TPA: DUF4240 domain-containing protein [Candidatus Glassbacteria bacterium]|nr:DUF4240 domain-containing protein [Candidatus Glassbacteria bacterium]